MEKSPLIVALDVPTIEEAVKLVEETEEYADIYKVGPILFIKYGPSIVQEIIKRKKDVFLDLKLHDIPNTVKEAVRQASEMGVYMLTLHTLGGSEMLEAAVSAKKGKLPILLGVTVLTSMKDEHLKELGINATCREQVKRLVQLGKRAGIDGFVCSVEEVEEVKNTAPYTVAVVPGIRPESFQKHDQKRTATPGEAVKRGADFIVVGRPIYASPSPREAAKAIVNEIEIAKKHR